MRGRRTFRFFWETANPENGLTPERYPTPSFASISDLVGRTMRGARHLRQGLERAGFSGGWLER